MEAELIFDNRKNYIESVREAGDSQDKGSVAERLSEKAGRVCYDSYGKGRSSEDYHAHILEVGHTSIYEHFNWVVEVTTPAHKVFESVANRPGIWVTKLFDKVRLTLNRRCIIDWELFGPKDELYYELLRSTRAVYDGGLPVKPIYTEEVWLSFQIRCSRGCSHELVRHKHRTAVSQRSTRYVDESLSDWELHPYLEPNEEITDLINRSRTAYTRCVEELSKEHGRKQARGAARGLLGNALSTELIFSASVAQWRRIIRQRDNPAADAEIRHLFRDYITPIVGP